MLPRLARVFVVAILGVAFHYDAALAQSGAAYQLQEIDPAFTPRGVSDAGKVVGWHGATGAVWTPDGGLVPIAAPNGIVFPAYSGGLLFDPSPLAISPDGRFVVAVAGYTSANGWTTEPALLESSGAFTLLGRFPVNGGIGQPGAVNNAGSVAGHAWGGGYNNYGPFVWQNGSGLQQLAGYAAGSNYDRNGAAFDINGSGEVVGTCGGSVCTGPPHYSAAFVWSPSGGFTVLPFFDGSTADEALAINDLGVVVGRAHIPTSNGGSTWRVWRWSPTEGLQDLNAPNDYPQSLDINNAGEVVLSVNTSQGPVPYIYRNGVWSNLNDFIPAEAGLVLQSARAISNTGHIVGDGRDASGTFTTGVILWLVDGTDPDSDVTAPELTVPTLITVNATGPNGAVVEFSATATDDRDVGPVVACDWHSGATFPIGGTTVHCTARDAANNTSAASFTVTVNGALLQTQELRSLVASWYAVLGKPVNEWLFSRLGRLELAIQGSACSTSPGGGGRACDEPCPLSREILHYVQKNARRIPAEQYDRVVGDLTRIRAVLACNAAVGQ